MKNNNYLKDESTFFEKTIIKTRSILNITTNINILTVCNF